MVSFLPNPKQWRDSSRHGDNGAKIIIILICHEANRPSQFQRNIRINVAYKTS